MKQLSVVIPTKNEEANIVACIRSFAAWRDAVEVIVVDNASTDATRRLAEAEGARVFEKGPERNAQRNLGWRRATAPWVLLLDADMTMPEATVREVLSRCGDGGADAYWIPEVRSGEGFRVKARNFERSFYNGTCIDALRLFRRTVLEATGGYDEALIAGGEDWELDIRVLALGTPCGMLANPLVHNERQLSRRRMLEKKAYYAKGLEQYRAKWPDHPAVRRQFSPWYRFVGVFVERGKWRKVLRHPILFAAVMFERVSVGVVYLLNRRNG